MIIKLLSKQIPTFWESIKFAIKVADEVDEKELQSTLNELLQALLSDKAQCFIVLDQGRILKGLMVTRVLVNKVTGKKFLSLQTLYVWSKLDNEEWSIAFNLVKQFAEKEKCAYLSFTSRNPVIWQRTEQFGFKEKTRTYTLNIG